MDIHPGYMGTATVAGISAFRFESASINAKQAFEAPDMVMGHWDHAAYHPGKIDISGSISGPATENFASGGASSLWGWAVTRGTCGGLSEKNIDISYFCDTTAKSRSFPNCLVNQVSFSCTAGDNAQFTLDVMGYTEPVWGTTGPTLNTDTEKIITWDNTGVTITSGTGLIVPVDALLSAFEFTVGNNCAPYYSLTQATGYYPTAIVPGLRTITGSITAYDPQEFNGALGFNNPTWDADTARATISFNIAGTTFDMKVQFHRNETTLSTGPIMSTIAFTGVGVQSF